MKFISVVFVFALVLGSATGQESRFVEPVTLHDYHPFRQLAAAANWDKRKVEIRNRVLLSAGLLPFPERTPLNTSRFGTVEREGFQVERICFESFPGHYVTGSLFTPRGKSLNLGLIDGKRPGILCPHGHWTNGRFFDLIEKSGERAVRAQIASGGERFETAARNPIIARCVQLARMGCVVLVYDMIGYADSVQLPEHRRGSRAEMNSSEAGKWGFISPQATLRLQTNFGLQTWNSIRALDCLSELAEVDTDRILVTGASGGATQTLVLAAIDDRVDASFPAVMASTAMQGGCTCENSHYLRIDQGNVDIAAAFAPKPQGLTAADDWTIELQTKGHPDLRSLYQQLKKPANYEAHFNTHFKHNYNQVSRAQMYAFVNSHFGLGFEAPILESDFAYLGKDDLSLLQGDTSPFVDYSEGEDHERALNRIWAENSDHQLLAALNPKNSNQEEGWLRTGWETILRANAVRDLVSQFELTEKQHTNGVVEMKGIIARESDGDSFTTLVHYPENWNNQVLIRLEPHGIAAGIEDAGDTTILIPDLYGQNDDAAQNQATAVSGNKVQPADSWQRSPIYFYGYNDSVFVRRVHDLVSAVSMVNNHPKWDATEIVIEARGELAAVALAAGVILGDQVDQISIDPEGFDFGKISDLNDDYMVPGALKYGGMAGLRALNSVAKDL